MSPRCRRVRCGLCGSAGPLHVNVTTAPICYPCLGIGLSVTAWLTWLRERVLRR